MKEGPLCFRGVSFLSMSLEISRKCSGPLVLDNEVGACSVSFSILSIRVRALSEEGE